MECVFILLYFLICIYIYIERDMEGEREMQIQLYIYIYIYIYRHTIYPSVCLGAQRARVRYHGMGVGRRHPLGTVVMGPISFSWNSDQSPYHFQDTRGCHFTKVKFTLGTFVDQLGTLGEAWGKVLGCQRPGEPRGRGHNDGTCKQRNLHMHIHIYILYIYIYMI